MIQNPFNLLHLAQYLLVYINSGLLQVMIDLLADYG